MEDKLFCRAPWVHMQTDPIGVYMPCCMFRESLGEINKESWKEVWNGEKMRDFRRRIYERDMKSLQEYCGRCVEYEKWGIGSQRLFMNRFGSEEQILETAKNGFVQPEKPEFLDIRFSKKCNLACVMCGEHASTRWETEKKKEHTGVNKAGLQNIYELMEDCKDTVKIIRFAGGEPLIIDEHLKFLENLIETGRTDLSLVYNTNLTVREYQGKDIFEMWKKFDDVEVTVSLDAAGYANDYIRYGSRWGEVIKNLAGVLKLGKNVRVIIHPTISILNLLRLGELDKVMYSLDPDLLIHWGNILSGPKPLSMYELPNVLRKHFHDHIYWMIEQESHFQLRERLHNIYTPILQELETMKEPEDAKGNYLEMRDFLTELDRRRGMDLFKVNPEFVEWFKECDELYGRS